ncbi:TetR/AcrR family transcriptional regulator [Rhodoligotrophos defluvii]|uniref:TetR/AcrR family transcriptional regulator n=1 Tax=Rhodoligotrophos defluvii TaxID=2561934 RepID=UPI0010C98AFE|nr:TetR/AcrR family transcriptional regulator [Rhodoligotrophos defluvii]
MRGRPRKKAAGSWEANEFSDDPGTRERMLEAAAELFLRQGFATTTIRQIAESCGVTPGAIYNHFSSKDEILYSIISFTQGTAEKEMHLALQRGSGDPKMRLYQVARALTSINCRYRINALASNKEYRGLEEPYLSEILAGRRRLRGYIERVLEEGGDAGVFILPQVAGKPSARIAGIAIGDMCIRAAEWFRPDGPATVEELAREYALMALRCVGVNDFMPPE